MLPVRNLESLTYREKIRDFTTLTRTLDEHLQQAVVPRVAEIRTLVKAHTLPDEDALPDVTIRNLVRSLLESEAFANDLLQRIEDYGLSIVNESGDILDGGRDRHSR